uniref:Uncharacterized protein n=1 Tax=Anguilla anguilla TaxID=7936 RepID=A0A0E9V928_ANGAN
MGHSCNPNGGKKNMALPFRQHFFFPKKVISSF